MIALGRVGADPELKNLEGGRAVCNFSLACNESWKDKSGQKQERTEWIRVQAWGNLAETCAKYLHKGSEALVEGRLQTREWDKEGIKRYSTEVVADRVIFVGGRNSAGAKPKDDRGPVPPPGDDDSIPF